MNLPLPASLKLTVPLILLGFAATLSAVEGNSTGSIVLMTFTDGDPSAPLTDFTTATTVNWGGTLIGRMAS